MSGRGPVGEDLGCSHFWMQRSPTQRPSSLEGSKTQGEGPTGTDSPPTPFHLRPVPAELRGQVRGTLQEALDPRPYPVPWPLARASAASPSSTGPWPRPPRFGSILGGLPADSPRPSSSLAGTGFPLRPTQGSRIDLLLLFA